MLRVPRYDRGIARLDFAPDAVLAPGVAPAKVDAVTGFVRATAYLARDGKLVYGDESGETWDELRPREELQRAAESFANAPLTDLHPDVMVTSDTWDGVARGHVIGTPYVTEPDADGVSYLAADLLVTADDMISTMRAGQVELSIGFWARIVDAPEGTGARYAQVDMLGNHVASVPRGRAGPTCRVFLDGAAVCAYDFAVTQDAQPVDMVDYPLPDGSIAQIPTSVAQLIVTLQSTVETLQKEATEPEDPPPPPPADDENAMPEDKDKPEEVAAEAAAEKPEKKKDEAPAGVRIDAATARAVVVRGMPWLEGKIDEMSDAELQPLVAAALLAPAPAVEAPRQDAAAGNPFDAAEPTKIEKKTDNTNAPIAGFLAARGL